MNKRLVDLKIAEMKKALYSKQYSKALKVYDTMNWNKISEVNYLSIGIRVLEKNEEYNRAKELLMRLYNKKVSNRVLASLVYVNIGLKEMEEAARFLEEFKDRAPLDMDYYILRYKLHKALKQDIKVLVQDLEDLKRVEYVEKWGYELAKIYHKLGDKDRCINECNRVLLWFGEGLYVDKARLLKEYYNYGEDMEKLTKEVFLEDNTEEVVEEIKEEMKENDEIEILKEIFEGFFEIKFFRENIISFFKEIKKKGYILPLLITGQCGLGKKDFIKKLLTVLFKLGYIKSSQIAKIKADHLNNEICEDKMLEFLEKGLIIENVSDISREMLEKLMDAINKNKENILIILDADDINAENLIKESQRSSELEYYAIHIPEYM